MTLIIEIESDGPAPLPHWVFYRLALDTLRAHGVAWRLPWDLVRMIPRHPDWTGPARLALMRDGQLVEGLSPPQLLRALEERCREALPGYQITISPAIDPSRFLPLERGRRRRYALRPGELHELLTVREDHNAEPQAL